MQLHPLPPIQRLYTSNRPMENKIYLSIISIESLSTCVPHIGKSLLCRENFAPPPSQNPVYALGCHPLYILYENLIYMGTLQIILSTFLTLFAHAWEKMITLQPSSLQIVIKSY